MDLKAVRFIDSKYTRVWNDFYLDTIIGWNEEWSRFREDYLARWKFREGNFDEYQR